jgi:peptidoglycan hydrolase-like protein with peptidoglycan-binding domain
VRALQRRLAALGYLTPVNGSFGASTARAVLAFRKANGMSRTSVANRAVFRRLARGGGAFHVRYPKAGKHVEFDWSRQVVVLARGARPVMTVHASSGTPATPTVLGSYRFYSKTPGFNSKGMYYSSYFTGGYAIHGYASVPTFPASHGCIRIPIASAVRAYRWIDIGDPVYTYR